MKEINRTLPLISVIIPCFNCEKYVKEAIRSIQEQTYNQLEILVVDDGSSDSTALYIDRIASEDKRIKIIHHEKNMGLVYSLNEMIDESKGEYIARMDADDISQKDRLNKQLNYLLDNPEIALCGTGYEVIDEYGKTCEIRRVPCICHEISDLFRIYNVMIHSSVMCRAEILKNNHYNEEYHYAEDYELWCRLVFSKGYALNNVQEPLVRYRKNINQVSYANKTVQSRSSEKVLKTYQLVDEKYIRIHASIFFECKKTTPIDAIYREYIKKIIKDLKGMDCRYAYVPMTTLLAFLKKNSKWLFMKYIFTPLGLYSMTRYLFGGVYGYIRKPL